MTTRANFDSELETLQNMLFEMTQRVNQMIDLAMRALATSNVELVETVLDSDDAVDNLDIEIEKHCIYLIALQQPTARDLRFVGSSMKISTDLERIGDHAVDIAKIARKLGSSHEDLNMGLLSDMAATVKRMLEDALRGFVNHDLTIIEKVITDDDQIDGMYAQFNRATIADMQDGSVDAVGESYLLFVGHYLERMADHIVNIAERVSYVETGNMSRDPES